MGEALTEIRHPEKLPETVHAHVIFVHGVDGLVEESWMSSAPEPEFWPDWLATDNNDIAVWSIGYPADTTYWKKKAGSAMALPDRGLNLLHRILDEPNLISGNIIFVGYSYGGLVVKSILRNAEQIATRDPRARQLLVRVRRVLFLSTPHLGSDGATLANRFALLARPRQTTTGLSSEDTNLRDLKGWFSEFAQSNSVEVLALYESKKLKFHNLVPFLVVKPSSGDPGIAGATVIQVDEDHDSIRSPFDRTSDVYVRIETFVCKPFDGAAKSTLTQDISDIGAGIQNIQDQLAKSTSSINRGMNLLEGMVRGGVENPVITGAGEQQLLRLRKARHVHGFDAKVQVTPFVEALISGELAVASKEFKQRALAWASRMLAASNASTSRTALAAAKLYGVSEETDLAEAFLKLFHDGDKSGALSIAAKYDSPMAHSAGLLIGMHGSTPSEALEWISQAGILRDALDAEGKFQLLRAKLLAEDWDGALSDASKISDVDYALSPMLILYSACAHLAPVIHLHFRPGIISSLPTDLGRMPLSDDADSLARREKAELLFERAAKAISEVQKAEIADVASDFALWLKLRHPEKGVEGRLQLEKSMADPNLRLRRLPMALSFGLKVDIDAADKEIQQEAIKSGDNSVAAAVARLALAEHRDEPAETAKDIQQHRTLLDKFYLPAMIDVLLVEALAKSAQIDEARTTLAQIDRSAIVPETMDRIERLVEEAAGCDVVTSREELYQASNSVVDLLNLVSALVENGPLSKLVVYSEMLFRETKGADDARTYVRAAFRAGEDGAVLSFLEEFPALLAGSAELKMAAAWSHFRMGDLKSATQALLTLPANYDSANQRQLRNSIAIYSGDWSALGTYVEEEWAAREDREAEDLVRAGHLARCIGSARASELIRAAAAKGNENPVVLLQCYGEAVAAGWENSEEVHQWLQEAATKSGEDGPVKQVGMREVLDLIPSNRAKGDELWARQLEGSLPAFVGAQGVNRGLLEAILLPALCNPEEQDPRRRSLIFAFSGARRPFQIHTKTFTLDPTALLTLSFLDLMQKVFDYADSIQLPHSTMGWLFEERQKLEFHQPSQIKAAKQVQKLVAEGVLRKFAGGRGDQQDGCRFGEDIARFLVAARSASSLGENPTYIVRPFPIPLPGSLLEEHAETGDVEQFFIGCGDLVRALKSNGKITAAEEGDALRYIGTHEKPWPNPPIPPVQATLILDDLSVSYLMHTGMLEKLRGSGFHVFISESKFEQTASLSTNEAWTSEAAAIVESIRSMVFSGLASGKVQLQQQPNRSEDLEVDGLESHPSALILNGPSQYIVVDDRFFNKHGRFGDKYSVTCIDLLRLLIDAKLLTPEQCHEHLTSLRRAGFAFVPIAEDELPGYLAASPVISGTLQETAELKAIRESLLRIRMTDALQLPEESLWMDSHSHMLLNAVRAQWSETIPDEESRARSAWAVELLDPRGWSHRNPKDAIPPIERYCGLLSALMLLPNATEETRNRYWTWLESDLLGPIRDENSEQYERLIQSMRAIVAGRLEDPGLGDFYSEEEKTREGDG